MTTPMPFIVTLRGVEIGRYPTAESAAAAARSVIDTEAESGPGARGDAPDPHELPVIAWQPPPQPVAFDAVGYWRQRVQELRAGRPTPGPPPAGETTVVLPRGPSTGYRSEVAMVYGGPPVLPPDLAAPAPVYGGPPMHGGPPVFDPARVRPRRRWFGKGRRDPR